MWHVQSAEVGARAEASNGQCVVSGTSQLSHTGCRIALAVRSVRMEGAAVTVYCSLLSLLLERGRGEGMALSCRSTACSDACILSLDTTATGKPASNEDG